MGHVVGRDGVRVGGEGKPGISFRNLWPSLSHRHCLSYNDAMIKVMYKNAPTVG